MTAPAPSDGLARASLTSRHVTSRRFAHRLFEALDAGLHLSVVSTQRWGEHDATRKAPAEPESAPECGLADGVRLHLIAELDHLPQASPESSTRKVCLIKEARERGSTTGLQKMPRLGEVMACLLYTSRCV